MLHLFTSFLLTGCFFAQEEVVFPPGLEPLEENRAPWPAPSDGDPRPEELSVISGENDSWYWAHGRGYIHASLDRSWEALQVPEVNVDRRRVDRWSWSSAENRNCDVSYIIHNAVEDIVTVEFDVTWCHGLVEGRSDAPEVVGIRFQKTDGSDFIDSMVASVTLYALEEDITAIECIEHLDAIMVGPEDVTATLSDLHASAVAWVHGEPLPNW